MNEWLMVLAVYTRDQGFKLEAINHVASYTKC